jgi:hypothetical protein
LILKIIKISLIPLNELRAIKLDSLWKNWLHFLF